jgi:hypothetical protein
MNYSVRPRWTRQLVIKFPVQINFNEVHPISKCTAPISCYYPFLEDILAFQDDGEYFIDEFMERNFFERCPLIWRTEIPQTIG